MGRENRRALPSTENENMADIVYSPGGDLIACVCSNKVSLWDTKTDKRHLAFRLEPDVDWGMQRRGFEYRDITEWISSDADYLCTGGFDGSVRMWKVIKNGDKYSVHMHWDPTTGHLTVENACIQDVQGLSHLNKQLLNQRGAVDDPVHFSPEESEVESETPMEDWIPAENKVEKSLVHQELVYLSSLTSQSDQPKSRTRRNPASQDRRDNRSTR
jgi:WD40 repeat protein